MKRKLGVQPFSATWAHAAHLGPFAQWDEDDEIEVGLDLGVLILGLRLKWGWRVIDPYRVDKKPGWDFGTMLQNDFGNWRYARAGEDLKKETIVEADLAGRIMPLPEADTIVDYSELIYGNVRAATEVDKHGTKVLGWPMVNVPNGHFFWIKEPPLGAEFKKEVEDENTD